MKKFNLKKISLVVMTAVSILSLTACGEDKKEKELTIEEKIALLEKQKQATEPVVPVTPASAPVAVETPVEAVNNTNTNNVKEVVAKPEDKVYKLSLKNSYSLSKQFAIDSFNAKDYQLAIEGLTEGVVLQPYRDNIGCAIGIGYNYYFRNKNEVQSVFTSANVNQSVTDKIKSVSNKNESCIVQASITAENARGIAKTDTEKNFKPGVIKLVGGDTIWNKLSANEQGTLLYFPQKMGLGGAQKFKSLWSNIKTYADNKTDANRQKVLGAMVVHYKIKDKDGNWVQKTDTRSHLLMSAMFTSPETFASILGTSSGNTGSFVKVAKSINVNIDSSKSIEDQVNENDDLNKTLSEITGTPEVQVLDEQNKVIDIQKSFETTPAQIKVESNTQAPSMASIIPSSLGGGSGVKTEPKAEIVKQEKGNITDLEHGVGSSNANDLIKKGYTSKRLDNGRIEVIPPGQEHTQAQPVQPSRKNQICNKTVMIQGQQVQVQVPCEQ